MVGMKLETIFASTAAAFAISASTGVAVAATYDFNLTYNVADQICGTTGTDEHCGIVFATTLPTDNPGDQYNIDVTFSQRVYISGSKSLSQIFAGLYDTEAAYGQPDLPNA